MVADQSIDFVFNYDSLVHVEHDVIGAYLHEMARKLTPNGTIFIHHSNMGEFAAHFARLDNIPRGRGLLSRWGWVEPGHHKRAPSMTADRFCDLAKSAGLHMMRQELVNWGTKRPIDCLSLACLPDSQWACEYRRFVNTDFGREAAYLSQVSRQYDHLNR